jgi:hypothetical protein
MDLEAFCKSVASQCHNINFYDVNLAAKTISEYISNNLDVYAPSETRKTSLKSNRYKQPWSYEISQAKKLRRKYERIYSRSGSQIHLQLLKEQNLFIRSLVKKARADDIKQKIMKCETSKELFGFYNSTIKQNANTLPSANNDSELANLFGTFFTEKVGKILLGFSPINATYCSLDNTDSFEHLSSFSPLSTDEISKLRKLKVSSKADGIPLHVFKPLWDYILESFTDLVNKSLAQGVFPSAYKIATLTPILKSSTLDSNNLASYRPVSNLPFFAKVLESAAASQLSKHLDAFLSPYQSAFRKNHGVESALSHVTTSIFHHLDQGSDVFLILLDLSAAFDTINHVLLLNILHDRFLIRGTALNWIESYLSDRSFKVNINGVNSNHFPLKVGVPQGSILGPLLFNCVMTKLADALAEFQVGHHIYADDTQIWFDFKPSDEAKIRKKVLLVFSMIEKFMSDHHLKLNPEKTVFLPISRKQKDFEPIQINSGCVVHPSTQARNLGIVFDNQMTFNAHITSLRRSCFHNIRNIQQIKHFIPSEMLHQIFLAMVVSKLDFCNSLYCALNCGQLRKIQVIQNSCARIITKTKLRDSITPKLAELHWLPIKYRYIYKLATWGHKIVYDDQTPSYLKSIIELRQSRRLTRASLVPSFIPPKYNLITVGGKGIDVHISTTWNSLPADLRNIEEFPEFKNHLKTYLFQQAF